MKRAIALSALALFSLSTLVHAHGPSRQKVVEEITINASADAVWEIISPWCSIADWHPAIFACEGEGGTEKGDTRVLTLGEEGGPTIDEALLKFEPEKRKLKYKITEVDVKVLPITTYSATITVSDNGDGTSTVKWKGGFYRGYPNNDPPPELSDEAAVKAVTGVYQAGLAGIKEMAEAK